jgi:uroporphyrinogen-III synthase
VASELPLAGRTVAVTRAAEQAGPLVTRLEALGALVFEVPLIAIADPLDGGAALRAAVAALDTYDWVVLTSPNAARRFLDAVGSGPVSPRIAAVGPGTAQVVLDRGRGVDLIPQRAIGEGLVEAFARGPGRVLFPRAEVARAVVAEGLADKGWTVDVVDAYRTVPAPVTPDHVKALLTADVVVLTSSSTATATASALAGAAPQRVVSMGIATTLTANNIGLPVAITADPSTIDGLLAACIAAVRS